MKVGIKMISSIGALYSAYAACKSFKGSGGWFDWKPKKSQNNNGNCTDLSSKGISSITYYPNLSTENFTACDRWQLFSDSNVKNEIIDDYQI